MPIRTRREAPAEEDVRARWDALEPERRAEVIHFVDAALVENVRVGVQSLFEKHVLMVQFGLSAQVGEDPFKDSSLLRDAFKFTWDVERASSNPAVMLVDPRRLPALTIKEEFASRTDCFSVFRRALPDFLSNKSGRTVGPRARWKEIVQAEPASIAAMERQLARLVEQALWAMALDPAYAIEDNSIEVVDCSETVALELWMEDGAKVGHADSKKSRRKKKRATQLEPMVEEGAEASAGEAEGTPQAPAAGEDAGVPSRAEASEGRCVPCAHGAAEERASSPTASYMTETATRAESSDEEEGRTSSACSGGGVRRGMDASSLRPPLTPPPSPRARYHMWQPQNLVCYIWTQTSQLSSQGSGRGASGESEEPISPSWCASRPTGDTRTPASEAPSLSQGRSTPWSRGQWQTPMGGGTPVAGGPAAVSVVVRNTFVDIDDPSHVEEEAESHRARSLSPSALAWAEEGSWYRGRSPRRCQ